MGLLDGIGDWILETITSWLVELVEIFISFLQNVLFNYNGLGGIALQAYNFFVWFGGLLLVVVALGTVITQIISETETSQQADVWRTLVGSVKAGGLLFILPVAIAFVMTGIIKPSTDYFIGLMGDELITSIESLIGSDSFVDAFGGALSQLLIWLFVMVVLGFFTIKIFVEQAQLLMDEILSPLVAISVVSETFNFVDNWWRDILSHTVTIIVLTLSMALFVEALTMQSDTIWTKLPALIGTGVLVISGPSLVKSIWYSSGTARTGQGMARTAMHMISRR